MFSPERCGTPPPISTARFSSARRSGVVFRVSRILAPVPSTACTNRRVMVATPDMRCRKFSATRSPVRMPRPPRKPISGEKVWIACDVGMMAPPPSPWNTRNTTKDGRFQARPHSVLAAVNMRIEIAK